MKVQKYTIKITACMVVQAVVKVNGQSSWQTSTPPWPWKSWMDFSKTSNI